MMAAFAWDPFTVSPILSQLKTVWELEKVKGLKLEELWLEGNPLCSTFPDHSAYVRYVMPADTFPYRDTIAS